MDEAPGLSDQYRTASPWPVFVALGLPIAELGILFDLFPLAVGGLLLFCGSIAGLLTEAEYVSSPWKALGGLAVVLFGFGGLLVFSELQLVTRGYAVVAAGILLLAGSIAGPMVVTDETVPA